MHRRQHVTQDAPAEARRDGVATLLGFSTSFSTDCEGSVEMHWPWRWGGRSINGRGVSGTEIDLQSTALVLVGVEPRAEGELEDKKLTGFRK
jgi:hypothetical protein